MRDTIALILRGILFGGAFGAKVGALVGMSGSDPWYWISTLMVTGILIGLACCFGIALGSQLEEKKKKQSIIQNTSQEDNIQLVKIKS